MNEQRPGDERIAEEAAEWLAALDTGRADHAAFEAWRAADPAHAIAFIRMNQTWRQLDRLGRGTQPCPETVQAPEPDTGETAGNAAAPSRRHLLKAAAVTGLAATGGGLFLARRAAAHVVETDVGERRRFYVGKHACLDLNTASRLRWWQGDDGIVVELDHGQLSLDLAPGAPACTVHAGPGEWRLGAGTYDVRLMPQGVVDLVTIQGEARLLPKRGSGTGEVRITRQQRLVVSPTGVGRPSPIPDGDVRALAAWREGELIFDGQTLDQAVAEYNRYLRTPIELSNGGIGRLRLGGRFLTSDPSEFLEALRVNFGIRAETQGDHILLDRHPGP